MLRINDSHTQRPLKTVIGTDLLTDNEKSTFALGGYHSLGDGMAYVANTEPRNTSFSDFETCLRKQLHSNFKIKYNPTKTKAHEIQGHSIYFYIPAWDSFLPICNVGRSGSNRLSANSEGEVVEYFEKGEIKQTPVISRGFVPAYEACKLALRNMKQGKIDEKKAVSAKDAGFK